MNYNHRKIERKWQEIWQKVKLYLTRDEVKGEENYYALVEFPYPSGNLHVGHWYAFSVPDIFARMLRMQGKNVLYPIGFDAFGLPAENAALKRGLSPKKWTYGNMEYMRKQLLTMGASFDWSREVVTCDPDYYKWTQWIFLQFFKAGLAYQADTPVNWCPSCKTVLANEQVVAGQCERCDSLVEQKNMKQWQLRITRYAEKLLKGLDKLDWPEEIKQSQRNWIGKSEGAEIEFRITNQESRVKRFVLLHGYTGSDREVFFPWVKKELEKNGFEVQIPRLPNTNNPKESEQVDYVLKNCIIDENTILVGHSLGAVVAMKALGKSKRHAAGLILLASAMDPNFPGVPARTFHKTFSWNFDSKLLKKLTGFRIVVSDLNEGEPRVGYLKSLAKKIEAKLITTHSQELHFTHGKEPEVLETLLSAISSSTSLSAKADISPRQGRRDEVVKVFTTRPDTIFGVTYLVLAPEHELISKLKNQNAKLQFKIQNWKEVEDYIKKAKAKTEIERLAKEKDKTGVELKGIKAINPATGEEIPIWVADYVMMGYGTGAIMAVPAHDERDFVFAKRHGLPIRQVIAPYFVSKDDPPKKGQEDVKRNAMVIIVRDPKAKKYLCLKWRAAEHWKTFVTGGVEQGEDIVKAASREVLEATGYKNLKFVRKFEFAAHEHFYHLVKKENRYARFLGLLFDLENNEQKEVAKSEQKLHEVIWVEENKVGDFVVADVFKYFWKVWREGEQAYVAPGVLINSGKYSGQKSQEAIPNMAKEFGKAKINYRFRDWIISRQRYWGCPIPITHCHRCGPQPVPEKNLPVELPEIKDYKPRGDGKSPLAKEDKWVKVKCPKCKGPAERETDTMDTFIDSSWYFLRYLDPKNTREFAAKEKMRQWMPVKRYSGGAEHTTMHLLYSRFWIKAMHDLGFVEWDEPYLERMNRGLILGPDGQKMSKSRGNIVDPDEFVRLLGADTVRMYLAFIGPYNEVGAYPWNPQGIMGIRRFLEKVTRLCVIPAKAGIQAPRSRIESGMTRIETILHKTIKKVTEDIEAFKFNTAISALMVLVNELGIKNYELRKERLETFLKLLAPFAPHITEELWQKLGHKTSIHLGKWPEYDPSFIIEEQIIVAIQINGKLRGTVKASPNASENEIRELAEKEHNIQKHISGKEVRKIIYVKGKILNLVV